MTYRKDDAWYGRKSKQRRNPSPLHCQPICSREDINGLIEGRKRTQIMLQKWLIR